MQRSKVNRAHRQFWDYAEKVAKEEEMSVVDMTKIIADEHNFIRQRKKQSKDPFFFKF